MYGYLQYLLFMLPALLLGVIAQLMVKSRYNKFSKIASARGLTGADAARAVLEANGVYNVGIGRVSGELTDHYNPQSNVINLSSGVYGSKSIAAIGIAAHEAGHALQYAENYSPIKFRMSLVPICNIGSRLGPILIIVGALLSYAAASLVSIGTLLYFAGLVIFSAVALFQLVTLPVELNASNRAIKSLERYNILDGDELKGAKKVLVAAALTYVAALFTAIMQILYYASRFRPNSRR